MHQPSRGLVRAAFVKSVAVFLGGLFLIPLGLLIRGLFDGVWRANWREAFFVSSSLSICAFVFFLITGLAEEWSTAKRQSNPHPVFAGVAWIRGVCLLNILVGTAGMIGTYREGDPPWVVAIGAIFIWLGFFSWPRSICFIGGEVLQRRIFLGTKRISYNQIETVGCISSRPEITVFGKDGTRIVHTSSHADPVGFIEALHCIAGKEVAFPEEVLEVRR